jgi:hypothetical protein
MFEPRRLCVTYSIDTPDGRSIVFPIRLDEHGLLEDAPTEGPEWTQLGGSRCSGCTARCAACSAALAMAPVVEALRGIDSLQTVRTRVAMPHYTAEVECSVARVASSIMGLMMAASACSAMAPFRAMAIYHQPFASLEETVIRAAGFLLLGRWAQGSLGAEDPFAPLIDAWQQLEDINLRIGQSLQAHCNEDAALNGLANLDMFAKAGVFGLESALAALKPALQAWEMGLPAPAPA